VSACRRGRPPRDPVRQHGSGPHVDGDQCRAQRPRRWSTRRSARIARRPCRLSALVAALAAELGAQLSDRRRAPGARPTFPMDAKVAHGRQWAPGSGALPLGRHVRRRHLALLGRAPRRTPTSTRKCCGDRGAAGLHGRALEDLGQGSPPPEAIERGRGAAQTLASRSTCAGVPAALGRDAGILPHDMMVLTELGPAPPHAARRGRERQLRDSHPAPRHHAHREGARAPRGLRDHPRRRRRVHGRDRRASDSCSPPGFALLAARAGPAVGGGERGVELPHREPAHYDQEGRRGRAAARRSPSLCRCRSTGCPRSAIATEAQERAQPPRGHVETLARELESARTQPRGGDSRSWRSSCARSTRRGLETTVLITGESGTGKEVISRLVHQGSPREGRAFRGHQLRGAPRAAARIGALRPREGRVHGRPSPPRSCARAGRGRTLSWTRSARMSRKVRQVPARAREREFQRLGGTSHASRPTCA